MTRKRLVNTAFILALVTILYNVAEGLVSVFFGLSDDTLALLGFGLDSFVEVLSGTGILHMIYRMKKAGLEDVEARDRFERQALRITGTAFYILAAGLVAGSVITIVQGTKPVTTLPGVIISILSILTMYILMTWKLKIGKKLRSAAVIADAHCTRACFYLSFVLLASSGLYALFEIVWFDIAGSLAIAWYAFSEGRESFENAGLATIAACICLDNSRASCQPSMSSNRSILIIASVSAFRITKNQEPRTRNSECRLTPTFAPQLSASPTGISPAPQTAEPGWRRCRQRIPAGTRREGRLSNSSHSPTTAWPG